LFSYFFLAIFLIFFLYNFRNSQKMPKVLAADPSESQAPLDAITLADATSSSGRASPHPIPSRVLAKPRKSRIKTVVLPEKDDERLVLVEFISF
jgi:hypothetical protein